MSNMTLAVLVAFYLFLAIRWDLVRRTMPYVVGVCGVGVAIFSGVFMLGGGGVGLAMVFTVFGMLTAFGAGIAACCEMDLPIIDPQEPSEDEDKEVEIL